MASMINKMSGALFDDLKRTLEKNKEGGANGLRQALQSSLETCTFARGVMKRVEDDGIEAWDEDAEALYKLLGAERNTYDLMLKLLEAEEMPPDGEHAQTHLGHLLYHSAEARSLMVLLDWSQETAYDNPAGFSLALQDIGLLQSLGNIFFNSVMASQAVHLDSEFCDNLLERDKETLLLLNQYVFAMLRCGRLSDAKVILEFAGLPALASFVVMRELTTRPELTPIDQMHDHAHLATSRALFKQTASQLLTDDTPSAATQCIWATLCASLSHLLAHAESSEDYLWAYLSCAVDALVDEALLDSYAGDDEAMHKSMRQLAEGTPKTVAGIFAAMQESGESTPILTICGHLVAKDWEGVGKCLLASVGPEETLSPHMLRFAVHLLLLLKAAGKPIDVMALYSLLLQYVNVLKELDLISLGLYYAAQISELAQSGLI